MFEPLFDALGSVLNFIYTLVPNYGLAIMGLTVLVMALITPLTVKSTRSMLQMQRLQPEMKKIQEKYKGDRERLNQELMAFYQENKINPLGGCLPLVFQMPVFIIMYRLLRGLTERPGGLGTGVGHIAGQTGIGEALTPWKYTEMFFTPAHLNSSTELYQSLSNTNRMNFFGMDLSQSAAEALRTGLLVAIPYFLLLLVMLLTGLYQNRQLQARNSGATVNSQQQMIMKAMPFFLPVISFGFPAGLALYWCTQNLCRIGTNAYITRSVYDPHKKAEADKAIETTATEKGGAAKGGGKGGSKDGTAKQVGPGSDAKKSGTKKSGAKKRTGSNSSSTAKGGDTANGGAARQPGKSVRSQKAHENATGQRRSGTQSSSRPSGRRSGETRGGSGKPKQ